VLFTDIVGSTERADTIGDRAWRDLLRRHHAVVRRQLKRHRGREIDTAGDGFFATFAQPADAIACALDVANEVAALSLEVRAGIHVGEVEPMGDKVGGIAVHLAARILGVAEPGQILASGTVRELVSGSGFSFVDLGNRSLKGVTEEWHLYAVARPAAAEPPGAAEDATRPRRRWLSGRVVGAIGALALVVAVGEAAYLLTRDASQAANAAQGPNAVREVMADGKLGRAFAVGRGPSAIVVTPEALWVANSDGGTVSRVDRTSGEGAVIGSGAPMDLAITTGSLWVLDPFAGTVTVVTTNDTRVADTIDLHGRTIAATDDAVWLADDLHDQLHRIDPRTREVLDSIGLTAGSGPSALAVGPEGLWVVNGLARTISRLDPRSGRVVIGSLALSSAPTDIAVGPAGVWVLAVEADLLIEIDPATNRVARQVPVCDRAAALVVGEGVVWVACAGDRSVWRINADGAKPVITPLDGVPGGLAIDGDHIWVTIRES
jgi:DNA-binding beta-propeller fold protein YncE